MKNSILKSGVGIIYLFILAGVAAAIYTVVNWSTLPVLQRMIGLIFFMFSLHETEEFLFPGGFSEMVTGKLNFTLTKPYAHKLSVAGIVSIMCLMPLLFPQVIWLSMSIMILGALELVAHLGMIKLFKRERPYTPGMVSAMLMFPVAIYSITYVVQNSLMRPVEWLFSVLFMVGCFIISQAFVITVNGINYIEFVKSRKALGMVKQK
ncbi:MAG: HXXEE domain-containing protein [Desulfatitalea sp.]|nr:HXXEE domain-containing protein [Desulfatitalea sp.]NNJ99959.1 HXXEE domain-containing protein [Desulfatitalea sp.]